MAPTPHSLLSTPRSVAAFLAEPDDDLDEILDLTDRRRVLIRTLFGVTVPPDAADAVFDRTGAA